MLKLRKFKIIYFMLGSTFSLTIPIVYVAEKYDLFKYAVPVIKLTGVGIIVILLGIWTLKRYMTGFVGRLHPSAFKNVCRWVHLSLPYILLMLFMKFAESTFERTSATVYVLGALMTLGSAFESLHDHYSEVLSYIKKGDNTMYWKEKYNL